MGVTLRERIRGLARGVLARYPSAWLVWCDPRGDWGPLLEAASAGTFALETFAEWTAGDLGGPVGRRELDQRLAAGEPLVARVAAPADRLGWLWAPALLAEDVYARTLREQLLEWGWRPRGAMVADDELAVLARQGLDEDPAAWGGGGLQPDPAALLEVLAGGAAPDPDDRLVLELTAEAAGLPPPDAADLTAWRTRALARLLATQIAATAPELIGPGHDYVVPAERRGFALELLARWTDSLRLRRGLDEAVRAADRLLGLDGRPGEADARLGPFVSRAAERATFAGTCAGLARLGGRELLAGLAALTGDLDRHVSGFWAEAPAGRVPWDELGRLGRAAGALLAAAPRAAWASCDDAIGWYTAGGWRLDQAAGEVFRTRSAAEPELIGLMGPLRHAARARLEDQMIAWSDVWEAAGCPTPGLPTAGTWLAERLRAPGRTAVLEVDALRYDLGAALAARVNQREGAERASVRPARAPLPSITALGMGLALPIAEDELAADLVEGKWQLVHAGSGDLSQAARRQAWWREHGRVGEDMQVRLGDLLATGAPAPPTGRARLVVTDAIVDELGHDDELEGFGAETLVERYVGAIERLRDAGWTRVLIVTDHGFMTWPDSEEKAATPPAPDPAYSSRRALAYGPEVEIGGPKALAPGRRWRVAVPRGAARFKAYGGLGYFHGGASLQEWIIPCVGVEWPIDARPVGVTVQALPQVLSLRPRVSLEVERGSLFAEDVIARPVRVAIRDAGTREALFRSDEVVVTPDQAQVGVALTAVANATAGRGTELAIEVRDARTDEVIATGTSRLAVEMTGW